MEQVKPPMKLSVALGTETREIKMTWGLHQDLMRALPSAEHVGQMIAGGDSYIRDWVIRRCLTDLQKPIESDNELIDLFAVEIDLDEMLKVQAWAVAALLYFFAKSVMDTAETGKALASAVQPTP